MARKPVEGEGRTITVQARITPTLAARLDRKRKQKKVNLSRSDFIRQCIERGLS